jgi:hypothetical protein
MEVLYEDYNFPAAKRFHEILKEKGHKYTLAEVRAFIEKQNVAQVHKVVQKDRKNMSTITANEPNELFQIDLLDYQKFSRDNKGYNWILICVDVFTRQAHAEPMKNKTTAATKEAFEKIIDQAKPKVIFHDDGGEFKGQFDSFIEGEKILSIENKHGSHNALGIIDRFSRTLKTMIAKYMTAKNTNKWIDALPRMMKIYNDTPHNGIKKIKPNDADSGKNLLEISTLNFEKQIDNNQKIKAKVDKLHVGDKVRIKIEKGTFTKGYEITYSKEVYVIEKIVGTEVVLDDGKEYPLDRIQKVFEGATDIKATKRDKIEKVAMAKRKIAKEGIDDGLDGKYYK